LDSSQLGTVYVHTPLGKKLAEKGVSVSKLAELSGTSRADVSHYIHGRRRKVGKQNGQRIFQTLCNLGIEKIRKKRPPACRRCGLQYPTRKSETGEPEKRYPGFPPP
jgi:hypothetical protein